MPNIKAAEKWVRQSEKRTKRNLDVKTRLKTLYKKAVGAGGDALKAVESEFDKAAQKGIIHPNKAARKKSRMAKAAARTSTAAASPAAKKSTSTKSTKKKAAK